MMLLNAFSGLYAVLPVEQLPSTDPRVRAELLQRLTAQPPDRSSWEVGGGCNFMLAAARLGLQVASVGHIGTDVYGEFMDGVLLEEGVRPTTRIAEPRPASASAQSPSSPSWPPGSSLPCVLDSTLICFVLVDPEGRHAFCSRYDFGPWPLLEGIGRLPDRATRLLRSARAVVTNGFLFDELPLEVVRGAALDAIEHGAAIFFDPGPRCASMLEGPRRAALDLLMDLSAVVLMTEEEAHTVTGLSDPEAAARAVLSRPGARARWVVVKMGAAGALLAERPAGAGRGNGNGNGHGHGQGAGEAATITRVGAVKVEVADTVGCGDSFAAAIVMGFTRGWSPDVTLALANAVGGATATGRGAGRNVARADDVLALLQRGAEGRGCGEGDGPAQRAAFAAARERLLEALAARRGGRGAAQLSAAA
ncbi:hypothetical protein GPECTOR_5g347 [Gonium pectorale]|uniref:Carbohydrate kinase PfkB domain-containing protein n=1 Tax=Gonium pectorale TaxID=33097 RepID=A0A150GWI9_GONPE|nr:hypothetical protein GPECTOR_5g347 [Gonium pectorale]|eukprot:KXZ54257.1 hypothetical protein GPECTOR_5g347 [Gonium pectorale]